MTARRGTTRARSRTSSPKTEDQAAAGDGGRAGRRPKRDLVVVKLGGSLAAGTPPRPWLDAVVEAPASVVLVPGGGPFADQVRDLQGQWALTDPLAHRLAIAAMEQFGQVLASLHPGLQTAASRSALSMTLRAGRVPVWLPSRMTLDAPDIPESWEVTSDSLALWLAGLLGARATILVKAKEPPRSPAKARTLAKRGLIDGAFPIFLESAACRASCLGPSGLNALGEALASGGLPGTEILA